jgi:uncharacterized protein YcaQ
LGQLHDLGQVRVVRRENGIRIYGPPRALEPPPALDACTDALVDLVVGLYAPLPKASLMSTLGRLRYALPHAVPAVKKSLRRAKERLASNGEWFWPAGETPDGEVRDVVRFLAPFDPLVWDRRRFERLWGWPYRFEAYTPARKRQYGYYALPLLWRDEVIGYWSDGELGFVKCKPKDRAFRAALDKELERFTIFTQQP